MTKAEERIKLPEANSKRWLSLKDLDGEHWRFIPDYEDRYMISNYGRVKSLEITITNITNVNSPFLIRISNNLSESTSSPYLALTRKS